MSAVEKYYNEFYRELALIDAKYNSFDKIKDIFPDIPRGSKILDIGSGFGSVSEYLLKNGFEVTAIEINDEAIEVLKNKGFRVIKHDLNYPIEINEKFKVVLLLDVLEHVFNPLQLLENAKSLLEPGGYIIATVPLYFDIFDRIKILLTGSIISLDLLVYGEEIYKKFRSYNYDHIRFFRPKDVIEMGEILNLKLDKIIYIPSFYAGKNFIIKFISRLIANRFSVKISPNLFAHSVKVRWKTK